MKYIHCLVGSSITPATFVSLFYTQHRVLTIAKLEEGSEFGTLYYTYLQRKIKKEKVVHHRHSGAFLKVMVTFKQFSSYYLLMLPVSSSYVGFACRLFLMFNHE